jgi:hypothetical protein
MALKGWNTEQHDTAQGNRDAGQQKTGLVGIEDVEKEA